MSNLSYIQTGSDTSGMPSSSPLLQGVRRLANLLFLSDESASAGDAREKKTQKELRAVGFSRFQLDRHESKHIATYLQPNEHIKAGIRGHIYGVGGVLLVATDSRIMYLHDIPLFSNFEEFSYSVVSGISINRAAYLSSITLFTKFKAYQVDYINSRQAERFLAFVESKIYAPTLRNAANPRREVLII